MTARIIEGIDGSVDAYQYPAPVYQLKREEVDIPAMVNDAQRLLIKNRRQAFAASLVSEIWDNKYPSVRSFGYRRLYRGYPNSGSQRIQALDPMTGSINFPTYHMSSSSLSEFFTPLRIRDEGDFVQLRGLTYYVSQDHSKSTPAKKLDVIRHDVDEGLGVIASVKRRELDSVSYLLYLGILDHLKTHALTTFHALTFHERTGLISEGRDYSDVRKDAEKLMLTTTRAYYQAILGQPFDLEFSPRYIKDALGRVSDYIVGSDHSVEHFTFAESNNPLTIMLGAHEAARKKPNPDLIIGIPSGGTEVAVATGLAYEKLHQDRSSPKIAFVPLSFHYRDQYGIDLDKLVDILRVSTDIEGRSVLVVDDNSNTGSTIQRMVDAAIGAGANNVRVHVAEIDPGRLIANSRKENITDFGAAKVANLYHPDFETAMGTAWTSDNGDDLRRKWAMRFAHRTHRQVERKMDGYRSV